MASPTQQEERIRAHLVGSAMVGLREANPSEGSPALADFTGAVEVSMAALGAGMEAVEATDKPAEVT